MNAVSAQVNKVTGWTSVPFGQVVTLINGRAYKKSELLDEGTPVLRIQNLNGGDRWYYSDLQLPPDKYCDRDDLLFAWSASFGPYIWDGEQVIYHYHIWKVIPGPSLDKRFAFRLLGFLTQSVKDAAHGVAMLHITKGKMEAWEVPIPPLAEQKRIAAILDAADALRAKRRESLAQLDILLQSTFLDMFGDPVTNPMGWSVNNLKDLCTGITDIDHKMPKAIDSGIPFISAKDLADDGTISFEGVKQISAEDFKHLSRKGKPQKGDILYSRIGTVGKARLVEVDFDFLASYSCCTIKPNRELVDTHFLCSLLDSPFILRQALDGVRAIGVPDLGLAKIRAFKIIIPPLDLQHRFAAIVEAVEQQKFRQRAHLAELDTLFASLQSRAFRGDL